MMCIVGFCPIFSHLTLRSRALRKRWSCGTENLGTRISFEGLNFIRWELDEPIKHF